MDTKGIGNKPNINTGVSSNNVSDSSLLKDIQSSNPEGVAKGKQDFNVSLSGKAQEMMIARKKAMAIARDTSPIREDKVAEFRDKIKNGTYSLDAGNIADGIMKEAIRDELSKTTEA